MPCGYCTLQFRRLNQQHLIEAASFKFALTSRYRDSSDVVGAVAEKPQQAKINCSSMVFNKPVLKIKISRDQYRYEQS